VLSAKIIRFMRRPKPRAVRCVCSTTASRSAAKLEDLGTDDVDTSPCEYVRPEGPDPKSKET